MLKLPLFNLYDKPEQPKLLPGRKPIIQIAERSTQSKTILTVSTPESYKILESSGHHEKVIPVSNYTVPQTISGHGSPSRTIKMMACMMLERKSQFMMIQFIGSLPNQMKYLHRLLKRKFENQTLTHWNRTLT